MAGTAPGLDDMLSPATYKSSCQADMLLNSSPVSKSHLPLPPELRCGIAGIAPNAYQRAYPGPGRTEKYKMRSVGHLHSLSD